jgi:hypothetical protein
MMAMPACRSNESVSQFKVIWMACCFGATSSSVARKQPLDDLLVEALRWNDRDMGSTTIAEAAESLGLTQAKLAILLGIDKPILSRQHLWNDPSWLQRLDGETIAKLAKLPGLVGNTSEEQYCEERHADVAVRLRSYGGTLQSQPDFSTPEGRVRAFYLDNALEAAIRILQCSTQQRDKEALDDTADYVACFYSQHYTGEEGTLRSVLDPRGSVITFQPLSRLLDATRDVVERLQESTTSFFGEHRTFALQILGYALERLAPSERLWEPHIDARTAFPVRGMTIGRIIETGDDDLAKWYALKVRDNPVLRAVEVPAFLLWAGDSRATRAGGLKLDPKMTHATTRTIDALVREVTDTRCPVAYVYYLTETFIPTLRASNLVAVDMPRMRRFIQHLEERADVMKGFAHDSAARLIVDLKKSGAA